MNVLVTGSNGQLGRCLQDIVTERRGANAHFYFTDIDTLDITKEEEVRHFVIQHHIDVIINTAAYTAVDKAETEIESAYLINYEAVKNLAFLAYQQNIFLIHISTDYVFDGSATQPYQTDTPPNPISIYGKTKAKGERAILEANGHSVIIRTSWLYSEYGHNFLKTMLKSGNERETINVVDDQIGAPTYAGDLAKAIISITGIRKNIVQPNIYHYANEGTISWYDFAKKIMQIAELPCRINAIPSKLYATQAQRPAYSVFDLSKIKNDCHLTIPKWNESLVTCIKKIERLSKQ